MGGKLYIVTRSLLEMHPNTMLARSASEQWLPDQVKEVFLERDGDQFGLVLDYLRDDGYVVLPLTVSKPSFMADLVYYGVENIDEKKIVCFQDPAFGCLNDIKMRLCEKYKAEIRSWVVHRTSVLLAMECVNRYLISGYKLKIEIHGPRVEYLERYDILLCPDETFMAISSLFHNGTNDLSTAQKKCNTFLASIGLKIIHLNNIAHRSVIEVSMTYIVT